jgi:hypothetical protein
MQKKTRPPSAERDRGPSRTPALLMGRILKQYSMCRAFPSEKTFESKPQATESADLNKWHTDGCPADRVWE